MSKRKDSSWVTEILAESNMPSDEFTWTDGSNYGLDGFHFEQTMGEGSLDQARLPSVHGLSDLPDGFVHTSSAPFEVDGRSVDSGGTDLSAFLSEEEGALHMTSEARQAASLADLRWLDPTQEQDPERLPHGLFPERSPKPSIPELEEAWGVNQRVSGFELRPSRDLDALRYEASIKEGKKATQESDVGDVLRRGLRRATYGHPLSEIVAEVNQRLGSDTPIAKKVAQAITDDYGLAGNVFIRASAFPGILDGHHAEVRKQARRARYVITDNPRVAKALGLIAVSEVPWARALRQYEPKLKAARYRVASGDPKEVLRQAFLSGPAPEARPLQHQPRDVRPSERISVSDARQAFQAAPRPERQVVEVDRYAQDLKKALSRVARYALSNQITREDALRLGQSKARPADILKAAAALVQANRIQEARYAGTGTLVPKQKVAGHQEAWAALASAEGSALRETREFEAANMAKAKKHVAAMVASGALTKQEAVYAVQHGTTAEQVVTLAAAIVQQAGQSRKARMVTQKAKAFEGPVLTAALQQTPAQVALPKAERMMMTAAKTSGIKLAEFRHLASWLRKQMTEGVMGSDLSVLLRTRFASPLRKAGASIIKDLRETHEGLSGVTYVDTEAYASVSGSAGCEKHAARHRTNQIKFALAMDRCSSCVFKSAGDQGKAHCTQYRKPLLFAPPRNAKALKAAALKAADATDFETTAALFDHSEFNLTSPMDEISLDTAPSNQCLGDVLFGEGLTLED
jgi:hypothetical protein